MIKHKIINNNLKANLHLKWIKEILKMEAAQKRMNKSQNPFKNKIKAKVKI
jgi:hypothetical protein